MNVIEVDNLTKDYGSRRGVFDISFYVGKAKFSAFWALTAPESPRR